MAEDDFNRLYERLVGRRTKKTPTAAVDRTEDVEKVAAASKEAAERDDAASEEAAEAARREETRRNQQLERDARVSRAVKRLKLGRNLRGLGRLSRCSPHRLAFQLAAATEQEGRHLLQRYRRVAPRGPWRKHQEGRTVQLKRCMRLEGVAARLYRCRAAEFRNAKTRIEGKHRVIDELLFFSPLNSRFQSLIGYADQDNVVPPPPDLKFAEE